jgi:6-phospho-beta-glucosidase
MALKTIPALQKYCELIRRYAKHDVMVFNFSNPSGLVTQAMRDLGYDFVYGVCDAPSGFLNQVARFRKMPVEALRMDVFGLNHLSYFSKITENCDNITKALLNEPKLYTETDMRYFEPELAHKWDLLFNEYLYYFYYREKAVHNILNSKFTRGEAILSINRSMINELKDLDPEKDFTKMLEIYAKYNHQRELSYMATESAVQRSESAAPAFDLFNALNSSVVISENLSHGSSLGTPTGILTPRTPRISVQVKF